AGKVREDGFDFPPDAFIPTADVAEEVIAVAGHPFQSRRADLLDPAQPRRLVGHGCFLRIPETTTFRARSRAIAATSVYGSAESRAPISRASQIFASRQSRITVFGGTRRRAAVSSTVRPPKNRSSMTIARRGSACARFSSASSSAHS